MKKKAPLFLISSLLIVIILPLLYSNYNSFILLTKNLNFNLETSQIYSGRYNGDMAIMYFDQNSMLSSEFNSQSITQRIPYNFSRPGYEYRVSSLDIWAELSYGYKIAGNVSEQIDINSSYAVFQEFIYPDIEKVDGIMIYLNYSIIYEPINYYYWDMFIYDENSTQIDWFWNYETRKVVDEWMRFEPTIYHFEPGKNYTIALRFWHPTLYYSYPFDFWKAENYTDPKYNKGVTSFFNGTYEFPVENDATTDMLCYLLYTEELEPSSIDIDFIINGQYVPPIYQETYVFWSHSFNTPLTQDINLTVLCDKVIPVISVYTDIYYTYLINASGIYNVHDNRIEWIVNYTYEEIPYGWPPPMLLFERDWDLDFLYDPYGVEMTNIYFGPISLYNHSYYGITTIFGRPFEKGTYIGEFHSPNYCTSIKTQVKSNGGFTNQASFELGQTIRFEAAIISSIYRSNEIEGTGTILLRTPSGQVIHNETGLTPLNGVLTSSEIVLNTEMAEGLYEVEVFWTNGKEVAYYTVQFEIRVPVNIVLIVAIAASIAFASVPLALVARRQIRQRNWEKSLKNLFVLTKDGLSLYEFSFGIEIQDPALIAGMIAALTQFVRETTGSKKLLRTIDQEDKKVILFHGEFTTVALLAEKNLPIIHNRIKKFTQEFESNFYKQIKSFDGEISAFKHADVIVNKYFPIDVEEQVIRAVRQKLIEFRERLDVLKDPRHIISLMREITEFLSRYRTIVNEHYLDYYNQIITSAEQKISTA
ncbi:MAG: hypothetical protein ACFE8E_09700 [Candidatus Hodarchaeota archaeon]